MTIKEAFEALAKVTSKGMKNPFFVMRGLKESFADVASKVESLEDMTTTKDAQIIGGKAVFDTIDGNLVKALKVAITPSQSGSGTPSPTNIRPISGHTQEIISVKDSAGTTQETYTISLGQTVYGGTLDVTTGELTIDSACVNMEDLNYSYNAQNNTFSTSVISDMADFISSEIQVKCSALGGISPKSAQGMAQAVDNSIAFNNSTANKFLRIKCTTYTDAVTFKTAMTGQQIVYKIATPTTLSLTPQKVKSLVGENHISASTGNVLQCRYSMMINGEDLEFLLS